MSRENVEVEWHGTNFKTGADGRCLPLATSRSTGRLPARPSPRRRGQGTQTRPVSPSERRGTMRQEARESGLVASYVEPER
jgi:hypothetical protein